MTSRRAKLDDKRRAALPMLKNRKKNEKSTHPRFLDCLSSFVLMNPPKNPAHVPLATPARRKEAIVSAVPSKNRKIELQERTVDLCSSVCVSDLLEGQLGVVLERRNAGVKGDGRGGHG